jgi:hypothetical protein
MDSNQSSSSAAARSAVTTQTAGVRSACYIDPAPLMDVMLDQLRYLLSHKGPGCSPECTDCERLAGAQSWLLLPFRITATQGSTAPADH